MLPSMPPPMPPRIDIDEPEPDCHATRPQPIADSTSRPTRMAVRGRERAQPLRRSRLCDRGHHPFQLKRLANPLRSCPEYSIPNADTCEHDTRRESEGWPRRVRDDVRERDLVSGLDGHALARVVDELTHLDPVVLAIVLDADRSLLDTEEFAEERPQGRRRTAELTRQHLAELAHLRFVCTVVDDDADLPVAVGHVRRRVGDHHEGPAGDVDAVDLAVIDIERRARSGSSRPGSPCERGSTTCRDRSRRTSSSRRSHLPTSSSSFVPHFPEPVWR